MLDEGSPAARFLALLDPFVLWWLAVLAIGLAVLYQARVRVMVLTLLGLYLGIALVLAGTMTVLGGAS
jgi:hypothetical protein